MPLELLLANNVEICVSTFGDRRDPAILLIAGACASMMSWDEEFCSTLAAQRRLVVRFDHRDTGRSQCYPAGSAPYDLADLTDDAVGVLDALDVAQAHVVGASMGGAIAQRLALDHTARAASLTLISSSPAASGDPDVDLPHPSLSVLRELDDVPPPDWSDRRSIADYLVTLVGIRAGADGHRDAEAVCRLVERTIAHGITASATNHTLIDYGEPWLRRLDSVAAPTLVIHGARDPLVPLAHARMLVRCIRQARLVVLPEAGHDLDRADWERVITSVLCHTSPKE
jgi:pimeloyl-ACP methyl ester carboxylesterase